MPETPSQEMHKAMFMQLVIMLSSSAMQYLGKIINPMTGKTELNLEAAQATIDMVEMIEAKTRGNLDRDEERMLKNTLTTLRMNYVETAAAPPPQVTPETPPAPEKVTGETKDGQEPKFHKTYT
ncbi:MAG: DUF1844 domain-containing protein [bacterium]